MEEVITPFTGRDWRFHLKKRIGQNGSFLSGTTSMCFVARADSCPHSSIAFGSPV
jgi:hypothetical protein